MKILILLLTLAVVSQALIQMEQNSQFKQIRNFEWKKGEPALSSAEVALTFAIRQSNTEKMAEKLLSISTPSSPEYGQIWTLEKINDFSKPSSESLQTVKNFLMQNGISNFEYSSGFLKTTVSFKVAEKLLNTKYYSFSNPKFPSVIANRCDSYSLPDDVASVVDFVAPTINFPAKFEAAKIPDLTSTATTNTPNSLRTLYNVGTTQGTRQNGARQCALGFLDQFYREVDLQNFYNTYYPTLSGTPLFNVVGPNSGRAGVEASLDVEYISALGSGVKTEFWSFAGVQPNGTNPDNEPFLDWLYYLGNTTDAPFIFSTSYGEQEDSVSFDYATRMNEEFVKGGLRGISFLFASGDSGVGANCVTFVPDYPTGSPYVTAVGATTSTGPETCASLSGGGFSNRWGQPTWQKNAVAAYLKNTPALPPSARYNISGRAYPDVSAQGTGYEVINQGITLRGVSGTSASCPVVSAIFALLNDARVSAGKAPMGFLNPFIYANSALFNDITAGSNPGCGTQGFPASAGWDPATGVGTPNYVKIVAAALALP